MKRAITLVITGMPIVLAVPFAAAQHPGMDMHPLMPGRQLFVRCEIPGLSPPGKVEARLAIDSASEERALDQLLHLPAPAEPIRLLRFLPNGVLEQECKPTNDKEGRPAVELLIEGPTQSFRRWLIADDQERNRLASFIATWRFMAVADDAKRDELFQLFKTEFTRDPVLVVSRSDGGERRETALTLNKPWKPDGIACTITAREFLPDYAIDRSGRKPVNQSDRRRNPAALVDIEMDGRTESRWVFARFPEFSKQKEQSLPVRVSMECAIEGANDTPDFALVAVGESRMELWTRSQNTCESAAVVVGDEIAVTGSPYKFRIAGFVPRGTIEERYARGERSKGVPALEIEYSNEKKVASRTWLPLGHHRTILTPTGSMIVSLNVQGGADAMGHP